MTSLIDLPRPDTAAWSEPQLPPAARISAGQPWQRVDNCYSSPCGQFHSGLWECEPGRWNIEYTEHEYCEILEGVSRLVDAQGKERTVRAGDRFVIPAGFRGSWEVLERCRKVYVIFEAQAG